MSGFGGQKRDETNRWKMWRNKEKRTEKGPDFSGTLDVDGKKYFIDGWPTVGDDGKVGMIGGTIKLKDKQPEPEAGGKSGGGAPRGGWAKGDDFPFAPER